MSDRMAIVRVARTLLFSIVVSVVCAEAVAHASASVEHPHLHTWRDFSVYQNQTQMYTLSELYRLQRCFYDKFTYPNNLKQIQEIESTLLAPNIQGRVDINRTLDGVELNTEYLFGRFSDPNVSGFIGVPVSHNITHFTADNNIAYATTVVLFNSTISGILQLPVTFDTWMTWDEKGLITQYDLVLRFFPYMLETLISAIGAKANATSYTQAQGMLHNVLATGVCDLHQTYCNGTDTQYNSTSQCMEYMTTRARLGQAYEAGRNTLLCRSLHGPLVKFRPTVHCPHLGPRGGGMCVDEKAYVEKVVLQYFANAPFVPSWTGG